MLREGARGEELGGPPALEMPAQNLLGPEISWGLASDGEGLENRYSSSGLWAGHWAVPGIFVMNVTGVHTKAA